MADRMYSFGRRGRPLKVLHPTAGQWLVAAAALCAWAAPAACYQQIELITLQPVRNLRLNDVPLAADLPSGTALALNEKGCLWTYSDSFLRDFRGRRQAHNLDVWGQPSEDLLNYRSDQPRPKVLLDLYDKRLSDLHFNLREDILWWTGELVYRFAFAFPIRSCRLCSRDGRPTVVGDWQWEKAGRAVKIYASADGRRWHLVWQSQKGRGGRTPVDAAIPPQALGAKTLYLKFWGQNNNVLFDLYLSGELDVPASVRRRILGAQALQVRCIPPSAAALAADGRPAAPQLAAAPALEQAVVRSGPDRLRIWLPGRCGMAFRLRNGRLVGLEGLWVRGVQIAAGPPLGGVGKLSVTVVGPGSISAPASWAEYLRQRERAGGKWPSRGRRPVEQIDLAGARIIEAVARGPEACVVLQPADHRLASVTVLLRPAELALSDAPRLRGLSCGFTLRPAGPWHPVAMDLHYYVPAIPGWFYVSQGWSRSVHARLSYLSAVTDPVPYRRRYYGYRQPLFFVAGPSGSFVEYLLRPEAALDKVDQELASLHRRIAIPVRPGGQVTPLLFLADTRPVSSLSQASDTYFSLCDAVARDLGEKFLGARLPIDPLPIAWDHSAGRILARIRTGRGGATGYLYRLARLMPQAARLGLGEIFVSGVIESDAGHSRREYLPGSICFGSICAPWRLRVSPGLGGEPGLRELCRAAHAHGIKIIIWMTPAHYSNSSPLLRAHPDWIAWRPDGTPETCGYRDITGVDLHTPAFDYAAGAYRRIRTATGLDGFWMDSYCTFGLLTSYTRDHPYPQLHRTMALQRELHRAGYTRLQIEACGPTGLSSGGHGGEEGLRELSQRPAGLYRFVCPTVKKLDYPVDVYFRCLANKCCPRFLAGNLAEVLEQRSYRDDWQQIAAINMAYMKALPHMKRRRLLGHRGVLWTDRAGYQVLWAYRRFSWPLKPGSTVRDLTARSPVENKPLQTTPGHVYLIAPPGGAN